MKELKNLRKPREKHFLNENGLITAYMYNEDVHYLKNQEYHEIDNSLIEKENYFQNKENSFQAHFFKNSENKIFEIIKDENFLSFSLNDSNHSIITTNKYAITYQNILKNIDISVTAIYKEKTAASFEEDITFIGLDIDAFLGVGVHLKLGFSI